MAVVAVVVVVVAVVVVVVVVNTDYLGTHVPTPSGRACTLLVELKSRWHHATILLWGGGTTLPSYYYSWRCTAGGTTLIPALWGNL